MREPLFTQTMQTGIVVCDVDAARSYVEMPAMVAERGIDLEGKPG